MANRQQKSRDYEEQRKFPRTGVIWRGTLKTDAETVECTVLNLSANGAKLKLRVPLIFNSQSGTLAIPRLGIFRAKVAWSRQKGADEIGLTFQDPPAAVALMLAETLPNSRAASIA